MGWRVLAMFGRARSSWLFLAFRVCALCFLSCEMQLRKFNAIIVGFALSMERVRASLVSPLQYSPSFNYITG